jgi:hypothetical protein
MEQRVRFGDLVRGSGRPRVITLWVEPEKDRALAAAVERNRVLTIIREPGRRDYGVIGLHVNVRGSYLLFPRPLPRKPGARVIGINYQLLG